ncbi:MAG: hypothetical protein DWQ07_13720 [Chloroflexi bacterium]|nr:MAG: hypothetical protein DWQ07_13720 [Chloroflexota bacterium]MBL1197418.1 hypothetical protein [Chloroflexota bacterium]NOH14714.1 hypothetical protein [Chloroflexota bacterium]
MRTLKSVAAIFLSLFVILLFASACSQTPATSTPALSPTQTPAPAKTTTVTPTSTTIPTISPTYDFAPAATITQQADANCPPIKPNAVLDTSGFDRLEAIILEVGIGQRIDRDTATYKDLQAAFTDVQKDIVDFLNQGGDVSRLLNFFAEGEGEEDHRHYAQVKVVDVTGDNEPEVFVLMALPVTWHEDMGYQTPNDGSWLTMSGQHTNLTVIGCQGEQYQRLAWFEEEYGTLVMPSILDLNADGIAEIIQPSYATPMLTTWLHLEILAWDGESFTRQVSKIDWYVTHWYFSEATIWNQHVTVRSGDFEFADIDGNGTAEVVIPSSVFRDCTVGTRLGDIVLQWTGHSYSGYLLRTAPEFRIHAVRDGDHMTAQGFFDEALVFYDRALNDETLLTWDPQNAQLIDSTCSPSSDQEQQQWGAHEYDRLVAYTLYRLMLLHTARGKMDIAQSYYNQLVSQYTSSAHKAYVELASTFWEAYSISEDLNAACEIVHSYANEHQEAVLDPLGSYYGQHARRYIAVDICPFGVVTGA